MGEGGERNLLRRLFAICRSRKLELAELPIRVVCRAPDLSDAAQLEELRAEVQAQPCKFIVLDPLYLSVGSTSGYDLHAMGRVLSAAQYIAQDVGAALMVVMHDNKTGTGSGAHRANGVGPAQWGRVVISGALIDKRTDKATQMSTVLVELQAIGGEIPDGRFAFERKVWVDDPNDLKSRMHYEVKQADATDGLSAATISRTSPAASAVRDVLSPATARSTKDLGVLTAEHGHHLRPRTIQSALKELADCGVAVEAGPGPDGRSKLWLLDREYLDGEDED
jgi:AAA domain